MSDSVRPHRQQPTRLPRQEHWAAIDDVLAENDYDLVQFSNYYTDGMNQTERIREPFRATTREALFLKLIETLYKKKSNGPVAKVYRRSIVEAHGIRVPEDMEVGEDRAFYIHYSLFMNSFCISDCPIYVVDTENEQSLSRKHREDLDEQTAHLNAYLEAAMQRSGVPEEERAEYQKALNYDRLRMVYSKAKALHRQELPLASIRQMSRQVSRGSAGEYQADERAGVTRLSWRVSGRCHEVRRRGQ